MLNRRELLVQGAKSMAAATLLSACRPPSPQTGVPDDKFPLAELSVAELAAAMQRGEHTSRSLTQLYLSRIAALDRKGPRLGAVLETNPHALDLADELDEERRAKGPRGPLHGIPVLLKDNIDTGDRMPTTAGSLVLAGSHAPRDATLVERLRAAGALLLGKASLSEWANFRSTRSFSGWNGIAGQCRNPYALDRSPCGSSSGSGVAVAANLCAVAVGTETDGSIVCPSSTTGIVGIKPTVGLISRAGVIPISASQDTAGPMGRTVADAAVLLAAMVGADPRDPRDPATAAVSTVPDYLKALDPQGLRGARIGVAHRYFGKHPGVDALIAAALKVMRDQGAVIVDAVELSDLSELGDREMVVLCYEFKAGLNAYLAERGGPVRSLADVIEANQRLADRELAFFGQEIFERAQRAGTLDDAVYKDARAACLRATRTDGIDALMDQHRLDAILAPTNGPAWTVDPISGDHFTGGSSSPAAIAGYPSITVPAGQVHGLPVGLSLFGRAFSETTLIRLAYAYEQASRLRRPPTFPASLALGL